jgi:glucose/arabinose dehydrogenase
MRADTTRWAGLTMVLLLSMACSAPTGAPGQTSDDPRAPTSQTFVQVPQGFAVSVFAEGLSGVRVLELGPDDRLYPVRSSAGEVVHFELNADGTASGGPAVVVSGLRQPFGLAFRDGDLYVGETHQVIRLRGPRFTQETITVPGRSLDPGDRVPPRRAAVRLGRFEL